MQILCFGDSNTYGYDPRGYFDGRYDTQDRWVDILAKQTNHSVINAGMNGRSIPRSPVSLPPVDLLLVMLGTNNLLEGMQPDQTAAKMEAFLDRVIPRCKKVLLVSPPPMVRGAWVDSEALVESSRMLAEKYEKVAKKWGILFVDTRNWQIPMAFDGVHFTENGHGIFAEKLLENGIG